jgi:hypothetical protein
MKPNPLPALNHFTVPCSFTDVFPFQIIELSDAFFVREAVFAVNRASFADSDDTAVMRAGTKKPRAEACGAL